MHSNPDFLFGLKNIQVPWCTQKSVLQREVESHRIRHHSANVAEYGVIISQQKFALLQIFVIYAPNFGLKTR